MLVASELTRSAEQMRAASSSIRSRIAQAWTHRGMLIDVGLDGPTATQGLERLTSLGAALEEPAERLTAVADVLDMAAVVQRELERAWDALAGSGSDGLGQLTALNPGLSVVHRAALAALAMQIRMLDQACAASVSGACLLAHEADLDRLVFHPDEPLERISERNLSTVPASIRDAVRGADGLLLEATPLSDDTGPHYGDGYTVMVGPPGDDSWRINPSSVTTMVAGVTTGDPAHLPGAIARAQQLAATTGGAVVVWQGYRPPVSVPSGVNPSYARAGADDLAAFQMALDERFPDARQVVIGHSYGSVVATRAAMDHGLFADELILAGSPGVPARSVDDLNLIGTNTRVLVADSPTDPILALRSGADAVHGFNPGDPRFGAEQIPGITGGHSDYFTDGAFVGEVGKAVRR